MCRLSGQRITRCRSAISPLTAEQLQQRRRARQAGGGGTAWLERYTVSVLTDPLSCAADLRVYRLMEEACLLPCRAQESITA
jgi:hypothetical protein